MTKEQLDAKAIHRILSIIQRPFNVDRDSEDDTVAEIIEVLKALGYNVDRTYTEG